MYCGGVGKQSLQSVSEYETKRDYIHYNPVKRGYVDLPEHWRYSSARDYLGDAGLIEIDRWT